MSISKIKSHTKKQDERYLRRRPLGPRKPLWKRLLPSLLLIAALGAALLFIAVAIISRELPNPNQLINREIAQSTKIYDRKGETILYEIHGEERRTLVPLQNIPDRVKWATISIEDKNFYKHGGFSVFAMVRTLITNVIYNQRAGGSTLTQQFIKNAVLTSEKKYSRKIKELILAQRLENKFSKDEILQMYLNEIPYGSNAYGVEAASEKYFGKSVTEVSLGEAAVLAALPQSPSRYSPYGPNKDILMGRKDYILGLMAEQGYISEIERDEARAQEIKFKGPESNIIAPHFVMYIKAILEEKYGTKMVEQGGLKIYTTLDAHAQKVAEEIIGEKTKDYPEKNGANNAALVAIDPKTGQIIAMVGSRDYFDDNIKGQVNVATSLRQPGSSMKPIVYASLFEQGYTPNTILYDVVTNFSTNPAEPYTPKNYNLKEYGPVKIRQALAGSLNIPAVKAIYLAGINKVLDLANNLGYTSLNDRSRFGLALVLGGAEVELLEHVNAYSAFARDGKISPVVGILKIEDKDGKPLEEYKETNKTVLSEKTARMITSIMSDNEARTYIFGSKNYLTLGDRPVAAKTGTTNDYHDAWTIGYTPSLVAGVWVGNTDNEEMKGKADGSILAAPIWNEFMKKILDGTPIEKFSDPGDYKTGKTIIDGELAKERLMVDVSTGELVSSSTPPELIGEVEATAHHSILYYVDTNNPLGPAPERPEKDPQFKIWEEAVKNWAIKNDPIASSSQIVPSDLHKPANKPIIQIISPTENQTITNNQLEVNIQASAPRGIYKTEYFINNVLWQTTWGQPSNLSTSINFLSNGFQVLKVRSCDDVENCSEASVNFNWLIKNNPINNTKNYLELSEPKNNTSIKLPTDKLEFVFSISQPLRAAKLNLISSKDGSSVVIRSLDKVDNQTVISIGEGLTAGSYRFYGELTDWNGEIIRSEEIDLTIQ